MRHSFIPVIALAALAGCADQSAQPQRGVGFGDYSLYQQQQAYLSQARAASPVSSQPAPVQTAPVAAAPLAAPVPVATAPLPASSPGSIGAEALAVLGVQPSGAAPAPTGAAAPQLPVQTAAALPPAAPVSAPPPQAAAEWRGANIVAFALATTHPVGQQMYRRTNLLGEARTARACARYPSPGLAQEAFLSRGGPERDPLGLDPDGDGYACGWDPAPFRNIRS